VLLELSEKGAIYERFGLNDQMHQLQYNKHCGSNSEKVIKARIIALKLIKILIIKNL